MLELILIVLFMWCVLLFASLMLGLGYWLTVLVETRCHQRPPNDQAALVILANILVLPPVAVLFLLLVHFIRGLWS